VEVTGLAPSYRARCITRDPAGSPGDHALEWHMEYCKPDRYHVTQLAQPGGEYDEWIAIGDDLWCQPFWFHRAGRDLVTGEHETDIGLGVGPYLMLLSGRDVRGGFTLEIAGRSLCVLEFTLEVGDDLVPAPATGGGTASYRVWIDRGSGSLRRVDVWPVIPGVSVDRAIECHTFAAYGEPNVIEPPGAGTRQPVSALFDYPRVRLVPGTVGGPEQRGSMSG
jgi:hypothetical protein